MTGDDRIRARLRSLPSVDVLAARIAAAGPPSRDTPPRSTGPGAAPPSRSAPATASAAAPSPAEAVAAARAVLDDRRAALLAGADDAPDLVAAGLAALRPSLRRVLNGTGVVLHTNLGRAPLAPSAVDAVLETARGYAGLELDLATGRRGSRDVHVSGPLRRLTGAEDALAVNNGAAATLLAIAAIGGPGARVAVSRGQLVEIGGGFRIPEVVAQAGAELVEVGTTNRTRRADYAAAVEAGANVVLRVHPSNFRTVGFVEETPIEELCDLGVPVVDDLGSGVLAPDVAALRDEPAVQRSIQAGVHAVCFSGDKLLGGPQAGVVAGRTEAVAACRRHPLLRALRPGRMTIAALAATLALHRDPERARTAIPILAMLDADPVELRERAERLADAGGGEVVDAVARVGGGALPLVELRGPAVAHDPPAGDADALLAALRASDPPLIGRIADGRVLVDPRTLPGDDLEAAARVLRAVLGDD